MKIQEENFKNDQAAAAGKVQEKQSEGLLLAETEGNSFLGEVCVLGDIMADETWTEADDETIANAMRSLGK